MNARPTRARWRIRLARGPLEVPGSRGRSNQAIADDMHLAVSGATEVIRALRPKTDGKVVVALRRRLIPYLSRMRSKSRGSDQNRSVTESAGQRPLSVSAAVHGMALAQPLNVETLSAPGGRANWGGRKSRHRGSSGVTPPADRRTIRLARSCGSSDRCRAHRTRDRRAPSRRDESRSRLRAQARGPATMGCQPSQP